MNLTAVLKYEFDDQTQWELMNGEVFEGNLTLFPPCETQKELGIEAGFHVDMMAFDEDGTSYGLFDDLGVFPTYQQAFQAANDYMKNGRTVKG